MEKGRKVNYGFKPILDVPVSSETIQREEICLQELKFLIKGEKDLEQLPKTILNDRFLLHFVRGKKCNEKKGLSTLKNYMLLRRKQYKDIFVDLAPSKRPVEKKICNKLHYMGENGASVGVLRLSEWDPNDLSIDCMLTTGMLFVETALQHEFIERNGMVFILDAQGFSMKHAKFATPFQVQKLITLFMNAFPMKYHKIIVTRAPTALTLLYRVAKYMLPSKMRERFEIYGSDLSALYEMYSPDVLPDWLGGELVGDEAIDLDFVQEIMDREEYYVNFARELYQS